MARQILSQRGIGDLQRSLERFESYNDGFILPDTFLVVRLDAHRMGDWGALNAEYPCGPTVTKALHTTARMLMTSTFRVLVAFVHGDEISLLVDPTETLNPMRRSKLISTVASAAAVHFMQASGKEALFEARLSELPTVERVIEYFFWQRRYCFRNAVTIALRSALTASGLSAEDAEKFIHGVSEPARLAKLREVGVPLESIAHTTRRGALLFFETLLRDGREHFRLNSNTTLPDDDEESVGLLTQILESALGEERLEHAAPATQREPTPAKVPANSDQQPKVRQERQFKGNKKTNVSVFKIASS
jgi:tRNA(His) 5'-end guanylyltransferase